MTLLAAPIQAELHLDFKVYQHEPQAPSALWNLFCFASLITDRNGWERNHFILRFLRLRENPMSCHSLTHVWWCDLAMKQITKANDITSLIIKLTSIGHITSSLDDIYIDWNDHRDNEIITTTFDAFLAWSQNNYIYSQKAQIPHLCLWLVLYFWYFYSNTGL